MSESDEHNVKAAGLGYAGWVVVYLGAMLVAFGVFRAGWLKGEYADLIMLAPLLLVPAMTRAQSGSLARRGISSPALRRYTRRIMAAVLLIVVTVIGIARFGLPHTDNPGAALLLAAALVLPGAGCVWAMVRYLAEEEDEFLRHQAMKAALLSLGFVLICGSVHGALQMVGLAPPANSLWVLVAWAFGMGFGNMWQWTRRS